MADPAPQIHGAWLPRNIREFLAAIRALLNARGGCFTAHGTRFVVVGCHPVSKFPTTALARDRNGNHDSRKPTGPFSDNANGAARFIGFEPAVCLWRNWRRTPPARRLIDAPTLRVD